MTATLISLISILTGIVGANIYGFVFRKYSFGIIGNSIAGVFGSVFLIKSVGRIGFDPKAIMLTSDVNLILFAINLIVSFLGGVIAVVLISKLKTKMS